jgi:hypothetical protein
MSALPAQRLGGRVGGFIPSPGPFRSFGEGGPRLDGPLYLKTVEDLADRASR